MMQEAFRHFPKRWRFVAELRKPCSVYAWAVRSPEALVSESLQLEQWPELRLQAGRVEFECNGPDDLRLAALVRLDGDERSVIGFVREPASEKGVICPRCHQHTTSRTISDAGSLWYCPKCRENVLTTSDGARQKCTVFGCVRAEPGSLTLESIAAGWIAHMQCGATVCTEHRVEHGAELEHEHREGPPFWPAVSVERTGSIHELCAELLHLLPADCEQRAGVAAVSESISFLLLPEDEPDAWRRLSVALVGFTPETELGRRVIDAFNAASAAAQKG